MEVEYLYLLMSLLQSLVKRAEALVNIFWFLLGSIDESFGEGQGKVNQLEGIYLSVLLEEQEKL